MFSLWDAKCVRFGIISNGKLLFGIILMEMERISNELVAVIWCLHATIDEILLNKQCFWWHSLVFFDIFCARSMNVHLQFGRFSKGSLGLYTLLYNSLYE